MVSTSRLSPSCLGNMRPTRVPGSFWCSSNWGTLPRHFVSPARPLGRPTLASSSIRSRSSRCRGWRCAEAMCARQFRARTGIGVQEMNHKTMMAPYTAALGRAYTLAGRPTEGVVVLNEAVAIAEAHNRANRSLFRALLSEAYLESGQPEEAARVAGVALAEARERKERGEEAWSLRALAAVVHSANRRDLGTAESYYRKALVLADELGMRPLGARCHAGLASVYRTQGNDAARNEHFAQALGMFRQMGMTYWLEKAENEAAPG